MTPIRANLVGTAQDCPSSDKSLRDKVLLLVGEAHRQLPRRQFGNLQSKVDDLAADIIGNAVPDTVRSGAVVSQRLRRALTISVIPAVKRGAGDGGDLALMEATKKRATKLEAKGKPVDFKKLLRMEPDSGTTNIRNVKSKHWTRWLGVENRCVVPLNSFSEFNKGDVCS
jgi:putative SOS response-associated peptidase YedK